MTKLGKKSFEEKLEEYLSNHPNATTEEIANALGCFVADNFSEKNGTKRKHHSSIKPVNISKEELTQYIAEHPKNSLKEIAEHFSCSATTIKKRIHQYGIQRKPIRSAQPKKTVPKETLEQSHPEKSLEKIEEPHEMQVNISKQELEQYIQVHPYQTLEEIGNYFKCSASAINQMFYQYGISRRKLLNKRQANFSKEELEEYMKLHPRQTLGEIGIHFGCSSYTILNKMQEYGIEQLPQRKGKISKQTLERYIANYPYRSIREIAVEFCCPVRILQDQIKEYGIARTQITASNLRQYVNHYPEKTLEQIANYFHCSVLGLRRSMERFQIQNPEKLFLEKYFAGSPIKTLNEIAKEFDCSARALETKLLEYAIPRDKSPRKFLYFYPVVLKNMRPEELEEYLNEHADQTWEEIAENFGYSVKTIQKLLKKYGIFRKGEAELSKETLEQYLALHPYSNIKEIALAFGCSETTAIAELSKYGIQSHSVETVLEEINHEKPVISKETLEQYIKEHPQNTIEEMANDFECSKKEIRQKIKEYGFKLPKEKKVKLSKEILEQYIAEHPEQTIKEISKYFDYDESTIYTKIKKYGIQRAKSSSNLKIEISKEDLQQYITEHPEQTLKEIAQAFGCSESTIQDRLFKFRIERTPHKKKQ